MIRLVAGFRARSLSIRAPLPLHIRTLSSKTDPSPILKDVDGMTSHAPSVPVTDVKTESDKQIARQPPVFNPLVFDEASKLELQGYEGSFNYPSVEGVWNEWKGLGPFSHDLDAKYPAGGLEGLDERTRGAWRVPHGSDWKTRFHKMKLIVKYFDGQLRNGRDLPEIVEEFDAHSKSNTFDAWRVALFHLKAKYKDMDVAEVGGIGHNLRPRSCSRTSA